MFDSLLVAGLTVGPLGVILLGIAMFKTPTFGKGLGGVSVALGVAEAVLLIDPESAVAVVGVFALISFHVAVGGRIYGLSRRGKEGGRGQGVTSSPHLTRTAKGLHEHAKKSAVMVTRQVMK